VLPPLTHTLLYTVLLHHPLLLPGINIGQPHFGECSAPNHPERRCKVVTGYNFVGDAYTGTRQGPPPVAGGKLVSCAGKEGRDLAGTHCTAC
jgi:hypothetical protein